MTHFAQALVALVTGTALVVTSITTVSIALYTQERGRQRDFERQIRNAAHDSMEFQDELYDIETNQQSVVVREEPPTGTEMFSPENCLWALQRYRLGFRLEELTPELADRWLKAARVLDSIIHLGPNADRMGLSESDVENLNQAISPVWPVEHAVEGYGEENFDYALVAKYMGFLGVVGLLLPLLVLISPSIDLISPLADGGHSPHIAFVGFVVMASLVVASSLFVNLYHMFTEDSHSD